MSAGWRTLKEIYRKWSNDKIGLLAAALAYNCLFALAPLLMILITVAGLVLGPAAAKGQIVNMVEGYVGKDGAVTLQNMVDVLNHEHKGILAAVIFFLALCWAIYGLFGALRGGLNTILKASSVGSGAWQTIRSGIFWVLILICGAFLIVASLLISSALIASRIEHYLYWPALKVATDWIIFTVMFALIFKFIPDAKLKWSYALIGAAVTAFMFVVGEFGISFYLGYVAGSSAYTAAGAVIIILLWVYYSANILFWGAEFTHLYSQIKEARNKVSQ